MPAHVPHLYQCGIENFIKITDFNLVFGGLSLANIALISYDAPLSYAAGFLSRCLVGDKRDSRSYFDEETDRLCILRLLLLRVSNFIGHELAAQVHNRAGTTYSVRTIGDSTPSLTRLPNCLQSA